MEATFPLSSFHRVTSGCRAEQSKTTYAAELDSKQEEIEVQSGLISAYEAEIAKLKKQVSNVINLLVAWSTLGYDLIQRSLLF